MQMFVPRKTTLQSTSAGASWGHKHGLYTHKPVFLHFHQRCCKKLQWKNLQNVLFSSKSEYFVWALPQENALKEAAWKSVYGFWTCFRTTMFPTLTFLHCFPAQTAHTSLWYVSDTKRSQLENFWKLFNIPSRIKKSPKPNKTQMLLFQALTKPTIIL